MNIYIDESGSINNQLPGNRDFFIALVYVKDSKKLQRVYSRLVSSTLERLRQLDQDKLDPTTGEVIRAGGRMFVNGKFQELKGSQFDAEMKHHAIDYLSQTPLFELYIIKLKNHCLTNRFCNNTARAFNYVLKQALSYYMKRGLLPIEECFLHIDERNERTDTRHFLQEYLNTELCLEHDIHAPFQVRYYESSQCHFIQIADIMANLFYSNSINHAYENDIQMLRERGILKHIYEYPLHVQ